MPEIDLDAFIFEEWNQADGFPVINQFIVHQNDEYECHEEWHDVLADYIYDNLNGFLSEVLCYPSAEMKMGCIELFTPEQQEQVVIDCVNSKKPTETEFELVRRYGTKSQYAKIKLKSD